MSNNTANINWNDHEKRYELWIDDKLKAYSVALPGVEENTPETHSIGYDHLYDAAKINGYTIQGGRHVTEETESETEK